MAINLDDVLLAAQRIDGGVRYTACEQSEAFNQLVDCELFFKREYHQVTGSFKERGARNALLSLSPEQKKCGVVAASAGNHALALARHGKLLGIPVTVVMPEFAPLIKAKRCLDLGAKVIHHGAHLLESKQEADRLAAEHGYEYINGYNDAAIMAGAGTIGLEILKQVPDADVIVVPVGGGGLIAGIATAVKARAPHIKIIGVEPERATSLLPALEAGKPLDCQMEATLADGLSVSTVGADAFEVCQRLVDDVVQINEHDIALAILRLIEIEKAVVEGAGATGAAAVLAGKVPGIEGKKVVTPLCGGNIDTATLGRILRRGLAVDGRLCRMSAHISDRPGGLANFTRILGEEGASVVNITHDRVFGGNEINNVSVLCTLETRDQAHIAKLTARLDAEGVPFALHDVHA